MFEVTEKAGEMIKEALKDKDPIPSDPGRIQRGWLIGTRSGSGSG